MARSTYIYVAHYIDTILVAGTVKYEVINYLKRNCPELAGVELRRYRDGNGSDYGTVDLEKEFKDENN